MVCCLVPAKLLVLLFFKPLELLDEVQHFNPVEFHGIKTRIVELFPDTKEFDGIAIT